MVYPKVVIFDVKFLGSTCIVMQEASDAHRKTADSDTVLTYQVSLVFSTSVSVYLRIFANQFNNPHKVHKVN